MKYPDGQEVKLGDELELWPGCKGIVVIDNDNNMAREDFSDMLGHLDVGVYIFCETAISKNYLQYPYI